MMKIRTITTLVFFLLAGFGLTACEGAIVVHKHQMAPLAQMPKDVQHSEKRIQEAYQFSVANKDVAEAVPCYCGCAGMGHTSSYDCYVSGQSVNGKMQFDDHATNCSICVDITQDTMRLLDEGKSTAQIYEQIEADYARFGPPTEKPELGDF